MISRLPGLSLPERAWGVVRRWALAWWRILYLGAVVCVLVLSPSSYGKVTRRAMLGVHWGLSAQLWQLK